MRVQLRRTKGARLPIDAVKVDRTTKWGNMFVVNPRVSPGSKGGAQYICVPTLEDAVECFREYAAIQDGYTAMVRRELRGKHLACWCKPGTPCHADVLLEIANAPVVRWEFSHCRACAAHDDDGPTPTWHDNAPGDGCPSEGPGADGCEALWFPIYADGGRGEPTRGRL